MNQGETQMGSEEQNAIRNYLLGQLGDKEKMRQIEENILLDDDFGETLSIAEDELIDEYLDGALKSGEEQRFFEHFLISEERKQKLSLTRNLRKYAAKNAESAAHPVYAAKEKRFFDWTMLWKSPVLRLAAIVLIVGGLGFGVWRTAFYESDAQRGLSQLRLAFQGQRPAEMRTSANFDYAPLPNTRGGEATKPADELALRRAQTFLLNAGEKPESHQALGLLFLTEKKFDQAIEQFNLALKGNERNATVYNDIGAALLEKSKQAEQAGDTGKSMEDKAQSLQALNRALEINPGLLEALFNKAIVLQKMAISQQASAAWEEYLKKDSTSPWADEARRNLELLKQQSSIPKDKPRIWQDFLQAFDDKDDPKAWKIISQTKELISGIMIQQQAAQKFLEAGLDESRKEEADKILSAFLYLGELEKRNAADPYFAELADYYSKTDTAKRQTLLSAHNELQKGHQLLREANCKQALESFDHSKELFLSAGDDWEAKLVEHRICYCLSQSDEIRQSNERLLALAEFSGQKKYKWLQTLADGWIGSNYSLLGEHSKSIRYSRKSLQTAEAISDVYNIQKASNQLTHEYLLIGDTKQTLESIYRSLSFKDLYFLSQRQNGRNLLFAVEGFYRFKFYDAAAAFAFEEEYVAKEELKDSRMLHTAHSHLALIYGKAGNYQKALHEIESGFQLSDSFGDEKIRRKQKTETQLRLANLQRESGECQKAGGNYQEVLRNYEGSEFSIDEYEARKGMLLCYIEQENAAAVSHEMPSLLKLFDENRQTIIEESDRNTFFDNEQDVYDIATNYAYSRLQNSEEAFGYAETSRARSLLGLLNTSAQMQQPLSLAEFRRKIPDKTQIVYYAVLADKVVVWQISAAKFVTVQKPIKAEELNGEIQNYVKLLTGRTDGTDAAKRLYEILIQPVEATLEPDKSICIIADKGLFQLPFAALISPKTNKYLIENYALYYAPSASVFVDETAIAAGKNKVENETILSIGNPSFSRPEYPELVDLPDASTEAQTIAGLYSEPKVFVDKAASKEKILSNLPETDVVHFAGHYVPNSKSPALSKMLLSSSDLTVEEITQKKLARARLMVLSACKTGVERFYNGEGMIGAARAFMVAGAPLVVASQWFVDSAATSQLMVKFHRNRKLQKLPTDQALRQAQINMLTDQKTGFQHPFYWAGFMQVGGYAEY